MENRLSQFAPIIAAFGCQTSYNSSSAQLEVISVPDGHDDLIEKMVAEISLFDDTATYVDGVSTLCVANFIDADPNPIDERARLNILHALGIMKDDRFIHQVLMLNKNNKSWHKSEVENTCTNFGEVCTHRGINPDPERKGRKSSRQPDEYHTRNTKGLINREQLVTPNLEKVFRLIPEENIISAKTYYMSIDKFDIRSFQKLPVDEQIKLVDQLKEAISA